MYIHVPFCNEKCDYCGFHSLSNCDELLVSKYIKKLEYDINNYIENNSIDKIKSLYIGGGTPSSINEKNLDKLISIIINNIRFSDNSEITMEFNPEDITHEKIKIVKSLINRISIGIQTFNTELQNIIGRKNHINYKETIHKNISLIQKYGIKNISCDIMFGLPQQTKEQLIDDLDFITSLQIKHISAYNITFEKGTILYKKYKKKLEKIENQNSYMHKIVDKICEKNNFKKYEISNYAIKNYECKHNYAIWYGSKYIGFGPTATSFDGTTRKTEQKLYEWLNLNNNQYYDKISHNKRIKEIFLMGLRTIKGWKLVNNNEYIIIKSTITKDKIKICKKEWQKIIHKIDKLKNMKLISNNSQIIKLTKRGLMFWNYIGTELL